MNWSREFSGNDYFFLLFFIMIYLIYFVRIFFITKKLKTSANSSFIKLIIRALYFGTFSIALLGPSFGKTEIEARSTAKEIYLAIDLSSSMNANDVAPSRLDKAKNEILNIIDKFKTDKLGIIIFNSEAVLTLPLTYDYENVKNRILNLKTSDLNRGSTSINSLLELINIKFFNPNPTLTKVCMIITDGEFFETTEINQIKKLNDNNVNLVLLGVGTQLGGKIPEFTGFKKDKNNNVVTTVLDIKQIAELSSKTNGNYFILNNQKNEILSLISYVNTLKSDQDSLNQTVTYNKFSYFILIGILLVCIDYLTTVNVLKL